MQATTPRIGLRRPAGERPASLIGNGTMVYDRGRRRIFPRRRLPEALTAVERVRQFARASPAEIEIRRRRGPRGGLRHHRDRRRGGLHLDRCRTRANDFRSAVRDRLIAGAMVPCNAGSQAQKFRRWYRAQVLALFKDVDAIIAPRRPAPPLDRPAHLRARGVEMPVRANLGLYTQPISFIGLPVAAVPIPLTPLPIGVQIIAAPWARGRALRIAHALERSGVAAPRQNRRTSAMIDSALLSGVSRAQREAVRCRPGSRFLPPKKNRGPDERCITGVLYRVRDTNAN